MKESEMKGKIEKGWGVGSSGRRKKLEEVDRSGQKWSEMKILDFIFRLEYLDPPPTIIEVVLVARLLADPAPPGEEGVV